MFKEVFSQGGNSIALRKNEKILILKPKPGPGGRDFYIVRNSKVSVLGLKHE